MSRSHTIRGIPEDLLARANARARERQESLDKVLLDALVAYVENRTPIQQFAASGGRARWKTVTRQQRSEMARKAVKVRWARAKARSKRGE